MLVEICSFWERNLIVRFLPLIRKRLADMICQFTKHPYASEYYHRPVLSSTHVLRFGNPNIDDSAILDST